MRRRSLIGPLLLIFIGALFLINNLRPDLISFEIVAAYWPFVLIGWGVLRLVEILFWWLTKKPLPAYGLSGGEWVLVVFICLIGCGLFVAHRYGPQFPPVFISGRGVDFFGEPFDYPVSEQRPAANIKRVVIENLRGNTRIVGSDAREIKVEGRKTIRAYNRAEADEANRKAPIEIVAQGDDIVVRTNQEQVSGERRISADLELAVPRGVSIQASGRNGDFDVLGVNGNIDISNRGSAGVRLGDIGGNVRVDIRNSDLVRAVNVKGNVDILGRGRDVELENIGGNVTINGYYSGDLQCRRLAKPIQFESGQTELRIEKVPGQFHMDLSAFSADGLTGPVRLTAKSRDVQIEKLTNALKLSVERGDIDLTLDPGPTGEIDATTKDGDIELKLSASATFNLVASTESGEATNEFGPALQVKTEGRGATLSGSAGAGPKISLATERGSITVTRQ